jgi:hypothetical protein
MAQSSQLGERFRLPGEISAIPRVGVAQGLVGFGVRAELDLAEGPRSRGTNIT